MPCDDIVEGMIKVKRSNRSYLDLLKIDDFIERFNYLRLDGVVGDPTFDHNRYVNQTLYSSYRWKKLRNDIIVRDMGCDLGVEGFEIHDKIIIHHINPISLDDILNESTLVFDPNNLICCSDRTHRAIHYGDANQIILEPVERRRGDTIPWKKMK